MRNAVLSAALLCLGISVSLVLPSESHAQSRIVGVVVDSLRGGIPLSGATVVLVSSNRYASADSLGRFVFDSVSGGVQQMALLHPSLDALDVSLPPVSVSVAASGETSVTLAIPAVRAMHRMICGGEAPPGAGMVIGTVARSQSVASDTSPMSVRATWSEMRIDEGKMSRLPREVAVAPDGRGTFLLCGVPASARVRIAAVHGGDTLSAQTVAVGSAGMIRVALGGDVNGRRTAQELEAVAVRANAASTAFGVFGTYEGFEERRRLGFGSFRVLEDHEKHTMSSITDIVADMRGITRGGKVLEPYATMRGRSGARCQPSYFIDGQYMGGDSILKVDIRTLQLMMPPSIITAVEVYTGSTLIPFKFDRSTQTGCGSIVVWTNRKNRPKS